MLCDGCIKNDVCCFTNIIDNKIKDVSRELNNSLVISTDITVDISCSSFIGAVVICRNEEVE